MADADIGGHLLGDADGRRGTAVTVQAMVFGNLDDRSGTGVLFTRNPLTGEGEPYGEWLPRGQGEDVVSGKADALPLADMAAAMPEAHQALMDAASRLESDARDVQDIEFTVGNGTLWLLQARVAKRSPEAAVRLAVLLSREGLINETRALHRVTAEQVEVLLRPRIDPAAAADAEVLASGKPACPGIAIGVIVTDAQEADDRADDGVDVTHNRLADIKTAVLLEALDGVPTSEYERRVMRWVGCWETHTVAVLAALLLRRARSAPPAA